MEKAQKINIDTNINNSSFSTRHSETISDKNPFDLKLNLNIICKNYENIESYFSSPC